MLKDRFDMEVKALMEEEGQRIYMSDELRGRILDTCKPRFLDRARALLNSYIEIPVPVTIGLLALALMVNLLPALNIDMDFNNRRIIKIGDSQVLVREVEDVSIYED